MSRKPLRRARRTSQFCPPALPPARTSVASCSRHPGESIRHSLPDRQECVPQLPSRRAVQASPRALQNLPARLKSRSSPCPSPSQYCSANPKGSAMRSPTKNKTLKPCVTNHESTAGPFPPFAARRVHASLRRVPHGLRERLLHLQNACSLSRRLSRALRDRWT